MSGRKDLQWSDYGSAILGQITYGRGIGRYINDLGTIGGGDAVFDESGTLHALPVFAGYASLQYGWPTSHWPGTLRSNVTYSWVSLDNYDLQQPADYRSTYRAAINILYYPVSHARIGAEFLWGRRRNVDGSAGAANSCSSRCATASEPLASSRARTELAPPGLSGIFAFLAPALAEDSTAMTFYGHAMMDMGYPTNQSDPNWFDVARPMKLSSFEGEFGDDGSWFTTVR